MKSSIYSAVIIAKNEERTIASCIRAMKQITDDVIVVLDHRSDDKTRYISEEMGARVYIKKWEGYSENKNFGVSLAINDWILCPDADEIPNDELIKNIKELKPELNKVYKFNIQTFFGDYAVRYCGWFPDWNIRLYNRQVMRWNDSKVHEKLVATKPVQPTRVDGLLLHYSFIDKVHMEQKFDYYAKMRAEEWIRQDKKPKWYKQWLGPTFRFFRTYILKAGFLDGKYGWIIAHNEYILKKKELVYWRAMYRKEN